MTRFARILGLFLILGGCSVVGCGGSNGAPPVSPTAAARGAVDVAKDAWVVAATACTDAAEESGDDLIRQKCADVLIPARTLIIAAAQAVDTQWSPKAACDLAQGVALVAKSLEALPLNFSADIKTVIDDAATLAVAAVGSASCSASDAGVGG